MVEYMDEVIGRVVGKVDELGLGENTLILYFSDNGTGREIRTKFNDERGERLIRGGKGQTTDAGTRVPCLARWTGTAPAGRVADDLIDSTDFWPTIAEACGVEQPKGVPRDGRSFLPQLRGERGKPREWTYCHYDPRPGHGKEAYTKLVRYARTQRYKLYDDGRMFEVPADEEEQRPLQPGSDSREASAARKLLGAALESRKALRRTPA
jgi:arylsulfatase A-like enzyme